jgi:hypothetical protein
MDKQPKQAEPNTKTMPANMQTRNSSGVGRFMAAKATAIITPPATTPQNATMIFHHWPVCLMTDESNIRQAA